MGGYGRRGSRTVACVFALLGGTACFDQTVGYGGPASTSAGTSSEGGDDDVDDPSVTATSVDGSTDTSGTDDTWGGFEEYCIDEATLEGPQCAAVAWDQILAMDLRPSEGWPTDVRVDRAPCTAFAIQQGHAGQGAAYDVGLSCLLPWNHTPRAFAIRVWVPGGAPMPWRMGARVELSVFVDWPPPAFYLGRDRFVVRDADTHEILVGGGTHDLYEEDDMFAPFVFERRFDACGQPRISDDGGSCSIPLYEGPFGVAVHTDTRDEPTLIMDAETAVVGGTTFFAHAARMTWACGCADLPRTSELVLLGTAFTESTAIDPPDCELFASDCGPGRQCVAVRSESGAWDRTTCVDTGDAAEGEPCTIDADCVGGTHCTPSGTGEATCRPACGGTIDALECPLGQWCSIDAAGDVPPLTCLPECDPLGGDCPVGEACYVDYGTFRFQCAPESEQPGAGEACSDTGCAAGAVCYHSGIPNDACGEYCCTALCDLDAPVCPEQHACIPRGSFGEAHPTLGLCLPA
jgi:hypothetical protein